MTLLLVMLVLVALSWPVPVALSRWRRPMTSPRAALLMWAFLSFAWITCAAALAAHGLPSAARPGGVAVVLLAVPVVAVVSFAVDAERGRRHVARLRLLGMWDPARRVVAVPISAGVAHTLPTWGRGVVVLSPAGLAGLAACERVALVAHEMSHALGRHHVIRAWFTAWRRVAPIPGSRIADRTSALLLEVVADGAACRVAGASATASALYTWCHGGNEGVGPWRPSPQTLARIRSITPRRSQVTRAGAPRA